MRSLLRSIASWIAAKWVSVTGVSQKAWTRNSPWRQGQIIPPALARKLNLFRDSSHQKFAIVVSHDCDIAAEPDREPYIEVIVGTRIEACRQDRLNARNVRILHVEYDAPGGKMALELVASYKQAVEKLDFAEYQPDPNFSLPEKELQALRSWLAARYRRAAIPDGLQELVGKILEETFKKGDRPRAIDKIYIDFEPDEEKLPEGEKYELSVVVVYDTHEVGSKETAEAAAERLNAQFKKTYCKDGVWAGVELTSCQVMADTEFTIFDVKNHKQFRLEHLSIREELENEPYDE